MLFRSEFDFTTNSYISLKIQGGTLNIHLDLTQAFTNATTGFKIGAEARSWDNSLFVTAESENLWTTCSQLYDNKVYYDNVSLKQVDAALPVEMVDFRGYTKGGKNYLSWETTNELNIAHFDIERSDNGKDFIKIGTVKGSNSTYQFVDDSPFGKFETFQKVLYYRLPYLSIA